LSVYSEIDRYLIHEETVLKHWTVKGWNIYATSIRLFLCKRSIFSRQVIETLYRFISSVELSRKRPLQRLFSAIILFIAGILLMYLGNILSYPFIASPQSRLPFEIVSYFFWSVGITLIVWFIMGVQKITLHIVGRDPISIPRELTDIVNFIRERQ